MKSMTGYGQASSRYHNLEISVEISSINRKNLEIFFILPKEWLGYEMPLTNRLREKIHRGKVTVTIRVKDFEKPDGFSWNEPLLNDALSFLESFCKARNVPYQLTPDLIFNIAKSFSTQSEYPSSDAIYGVLESTFLEALNAFVTMRQKEGHNLQIDIESRIQKMLTAIKNVKLESKNSLSRYKELLLQRLRQANLELDLNDERVLKEIALFADRSDITEEIVRLESHLGQFLSALSSKESIGRKLDFLCQELNREYNTLSAKGNHLGIIQNILDSRTELERVREQVQNVE